MKLHGIHNTDAKFWVHLFPLERLVCGYSVKEARRFLQDFGELIPAKSKNGRITAAGYVVPRNWAHNKEVPEEYLSGRDWENATDRQLGFWGQSVVLQLINDGIIFPKLRKPFKECNDRHTQYRIIDITNGDDETIEIKTERPKTGNIFIQAGELFHEVNITPNGEMRPVEISELT